VQRLVRHGQGYRCPSDGAAADHGDARGVGEGFLWASGNGGFQLIGGKRRGQTCLVGPPNQRVGEHDISNLSSCLAWERTVPTNNRLSRIRDVG